ncbi:MAG: c-type cytochrome [Candidatus Sulfotelmatobacter sp.]
MRYADAVNVRISWGILLLAALSTFFVSAGAQQPETKNEIARAKELSRHELPPDWAYAINPPADSSAPAKTPDASPRHVPDSDAAFTLSQVTDFFNPPDWHPAEHPSMPEIVSHGRAPDVFACGYCHLPNGQGRPENSSLAGLPVAYIVQQLADFKSGLRKSSEPRHAPTGAMIKYETKANEKEIRAAAEYFSPLKPRPWIRVVETSTVPGTHVAGWMLVPSDPVEMESIGQRIIETPENLERTELRDDHSGFVAYVPVGSLKKGEALATGGASKTLHCATCHGRDLKGKGKIPPLAGRSPSYIVRQLYDIQSGARAGAAAHQMKPVVTKLTVDDMVALAAYAASLNP